MIFEMAKKHQAHHTFKDRQKSMLFLKTFATDCKKYFALFEA